MTQHGTPSRRRPGWRRPGRSRSRRSGAVRAVLTVACLVVATSCSSDDTSGATSTTAPGTTTADTSTTANATAAPDEPRPSAGCSAGAVVPPGDADRSVDHEGGPRTWVEHTPPNLDAAVPAALVIDVHGFAEGVAIHRQMTEFAAVSDANGFLLVFPQGSGDVAYWNVAPGAEGPDDVGFIVALIDDVAARRCIDLRHVHMTGLSNGAMLAERLVCDAADRVASVAPVAGAMDFGDDCQPARPVPQLIIHGTADPILTFDSGAPTDAGLSTLSEVGGASDGSGALRQLESYFRPVPDVVDAIAQRNGCATAAEVAPEVEILADDVELRDYDCPIGAQVDFVVVEGGGHAWPGSEFSASIAAIVGYTTMKIEASELIWDFFAETPLDVAD